ncbi:MAG: cell wall metabolism sensor histidine kinase WalK, partial [Syntrophomonadaceae bacterium]|nr:cell wall metabolism sensor histidine kinase WalK [Syntrophomonadaceae bacterium]
GIPKQDQSCLFQRFFRASNVDRLEKSGLGLGLFISANIVQEHGGRIWVESEPGCGSTFYFSLPLDDDRLAESRH